MEQSAGWAILIRIGYSTPRDAVQATPPPPSTRLPTKSHKSLARSRSSSVASQRSMSVAMAASRSEHFSPRLRIEEQHLDAVSGNTCIEKVDCHEIMAVDVIGSVCKRVQSIKPGSREAPLRIEVLIQSILGAGGQSIIDDLDEGIQVLATSSLGTPGLVRHAPPLLDRHNRSVKKVGSHLGEQSAARRRRQRSGLADLHVLRLEPCEAS